MKESFSTCCLSQDFDFPAECHTISREIATLGALSSLQLNERFGDLSRISTSEKLEQFNWVGQQAQFIEQQSA